MKIFLKAVYVEKTHLPNVIVIEYKYKKTGVPEKSEGQWWGKKKEKPHLKHLRCGF